MDNAQCLIFALKFNALEDKYPILYEKLLSFDFEMVELPLVEALYELSHSHLEKNRTWMKPLL